MPSNLTVAPANQWNIGDEAIDHITALIQLSANNLAKGAHVIADAEERKIIYSSDVRLVKALHEAWDL